ncbi:TIGR02391 family protein [Amycolatopsis japonica]|uniref:TIGR02391 family protein n=1 Tax=Amycolatopsis japonica TaxID=208439 RepID=UPI00332703BA
MDVKWVREQLLSFIGLCEASVEARAQKHNHLSGLRAKEATIRAIMEAVSPSLAKEFTLEWPRGGPFPEIVAKEQAQRCLGFVLDEGEVAARLAPDSPTLPADKFHPWVWDSAKTLWSSQHFRQAVQAAATSINAKLQQKVGRRDISDAKLVQEALALSDPEPGRPRLRLPGDPAAESVQSRQRGALQLGQACTWVIRNPASHDDVEWDEQIALENSPHSASSPASLTSVRS